MHDTHISESNNDHESKNALEIFYNRFVSYFDLGSRKIHEDVFITWFENFKLS